MRYLFMSMCIIILIQSSLFGDEPILLRSFKINDTSSTVIHMKFSPDSKIVAAADWSNNIKLIDINTGNINCLLDTNPFYCRMFSFSPDGTLISGSSNCTYLWLWNTYSHVKINSVTINDGSNSSDMCSAIGFTPDGKYILTYTFNLDGKSKLIKYMDSHTLQFKKQVNINTDKDYRYKIFNKECSILAANDEINYNNIDIINTDTGKINNTIKIKGNYLVDYALSPDGKTIAAMVGLDSTIHDPITNEKIYQPDIVELWDINKSEYSSIISKEYFHTGLEFSPDSKYIALSCVYYNPIVTIWDLSTKTKVSNINSPKYEYITSMAFSPNGKNLTLGKSNGTIEIWDVKGLGIKSDKTTRTNK
jgi:WD40 repeat protein